MVVLLTIEGKCSRLRAKAAHFVGHLPGIEPCGAKLRICLALTINNGTDLAEQEEEIVTASLPQEQPEMLAGNLGATSTAFEVSCRKSARNLGIDPSESGETGSSAVYGAQ